MTKFILTTAGAKKGLLQNSTDLCAHIHRASSDAQSGKIHDFKPLIRADCARHHKTAARR